MGQVKLYHQLKPSQKCNYNELLDDNNHIDRNSANAIITEMLQNNNIEVNRSRISRWTGRRRIADVIPIPQNLIGVLIDWIFLI